MINIFPVDTINKQIEKLKELTPEEKEYWENERKKCEESPYYYYITYWSNPDTRWTEEEFNKHFKELENGIYNGFYKKRRRY